MMDLHVHTNHSDGEYSPGEVVDMASDKGVTLMSVTDHDCMDGNDEARERADALGIYYVNGIEFSCDDYKGLHMLGYKFDTSNTRLVHDCQAMRDSRLMRTHKLLTYLQTGGFKITFEEVRDEAKGLIGRPHIAQVLVNKGYAESVNDAFERLLNRKVLARAGATRFKYNMHQAIEAILDAGGYPVLAHYTTIGIDKVDFDVFFKHLVDLGLAGIEYDCSIFTEKDKRRAEKLAEKYGLFKTRGSDFHGGLVKPNLEIGTGINNNLSYEDEALFELFTS